MSIPSWGMPFFSITKEGSLRIVQWTSSDGLADDRMNSPSEVAEASKSMM